MTAAGALVGALVTALAIYLLAWKQGVSPYRLVLVGIGVAALLSSITQYLLTRAEIFEAQRAVVWLTGSLNGRGWEHVRTVGIADARAARRSSSRWSARCACCSSATTPPAGSASPSSAAAWRSCSSAVGPRRPGDRGGRPGRVRRVRRRRRSPGA